MDSTDSNSFDKLWYCFSNSMSMEQLLKFALTSKVILSYEIDYLNSFHDRLMQGLWKRSSNGCFYKMDDRHEKLAYIILNENYEAEVDKSLEKFRKMSNHTAAQKVFDEMSEPVLCETQIVSSEENDTHYLFSANEMNVSDSGILPQGEVVCDTDHVLDEMSDSIVSSNDNEAVLFDDDTVLVHSTDFPVGLDVLEPHTVHDSMSIEVLGCASRPTLIDRNQTSSAHDVFCELPEPNVCFVDAPIQKAFVAHKVFETVSQQDDSSEEKNDESEVEVATIDMVYEYPNYSCMFGQQMFASVGELDHPGFIYLANINSIGAQIRKPLTLSINNCHPLDESQAERLISEYQFYQVTPKPIYPFTEVENVSLCRGKRNTDFEGLVQNMMFEMKCSCRFVFDPGVLLKVKRDVEISLSTIFLNLQNGWNTSVEGQKLHNLGQLFAHLALGETLIDSTIQSLNVHHVDFYCLSSKAVAHNILMKAHSKNAHICLRVHLLYLPLVLDCWQPSVWGLSFGVSVQNSWITEQEFLLSYEPHFTFTTIVMLALILTLEDKGDFKREGVYPLWSTYNICATNGYVIWPLEYIESINLTWDPGIIDKIAYEQFRTSNVLRVGCWKDTILLTLWLMKYWAANSWISDVGAIGFVNFDHLSKVHKIPEMLLLNTINNWSIVLKFMDYTTMMMGYVIKNQNVTILIFDPGSFKGWLKMRNRLEAYQFTGCKRLKHMRYEDYQVYVFDLGGPLMRLVVGNTSILIEMIWVKKCATSSYKFLDVSSSFFIFDPGGTNESIRGGTYRTSSVTFEAAKIRTMLKWEADMLLENDKRNENDIIFVFDPGGPYLATCSYVDADKALEIINLQAKVFGCEANLILEDKDHFKGTVLIHTKNIMEGSLVI